jgi:thiamine biosynthesis lipoprotein
MKRTFFRMDTVVEVTVVAPHGRGPENVWRRTDSLLTDWEERFSQDSRRSELRALNHRTTKTVAVSSALARMIRLGRAYGDTTAGYFDITILPVKEVWGFGEIDTAKRIPTAGELTAALSRVGYRSLSVDDSSQTVSIDRGETVVDVGGIAKGCALREIDLMLRGMGFRNYLVSAGGDIVSRGRRRDGMPWKIGIQHPRDPDRLLASFSLDSGSVVTSGDYERFWIHDGVRYHHIFNPFTGRSCTGNQSVTIWSMDPVEADILSTGLFCRTAADIISFVEARPRLECLVVDSSGNTFVSSGWQGKIRLIE